MRVCLYRKSHNPPKQRYFRHRLVAEHFVPNPEAQPEVNHKDCDIENNTASNLEWVSKIENERHSHIIGGKPYRGYSVRYTDGSIINFTACSELAGYVGVTNRTVINWLKGVNQGFKQYGIDEIYYRDLA